MIVRLTLFKDSVAVAGTALLLGAAAMSSPAGPRRGFCAYASIEGRRRKRVRASNPARIEVTEGERVRLVVTSGDGVHGIEIKKFKVDKKMPRGGEPVTIEFVAAAAGEFPILCSEYCGDGHEDMKGMLVVGVPRSAS